MQIFKATSYCADLNISVRWLAAISVALRLEFGNPDATSLTPPDELSLPAEAMDATETAAVNHNASNALCQGGSNLSPNRGECARPVGS